jgi:hypothetical protein
MWPLGCSFEEISTVLRKGVWDVEDRRIEGLEYEAVITLKRLIPASKSANNAA